MLLSKIEMHYFFVYSQGGIGKIYLWQMMITRICSEGKIVLTIAFLIIASLLLLSGQTAYSRFKISLQIQDLEFYFKLMIL